nr:AAA-ATPase At5g57480-like [Ipomoea batatas]
MEFWTRLASIMGVWAFCQSFLQILFPPEIRCASVKLLHRLCNCFSSYCYYDITEIDGVNTNELYNAVQLYLSTSASLSGNRLSLTRGINSTAITFGLSNNDSLCDTFAGVKLVWEHIVTPRHSQSFTWRPLPEEKRGFLLCARKRDKATVLGPYLEHIMEKANEIRRLSRDRLLFTNSRGGSLDSRGHPWESVPFKHPSTFDTLAMDPVKKEEIKADLKDFANGEAFYQRTGRAWKRGYLLYGPPGTGKSSMIAAMANFLGYDIYDMELTEVHTNSELRKLLMKTSSKSIIVIEDIDCSVNLTNRERINGGGCSTREYSSAGGQGGEDGGNRITLSGLLNFTDGLWSCCGSERIFVFTTNHVEKLDPALLRSGRMDMHIHMSYCNFPALKILLKNYLGFEAAEQEEDEEEALRQLAKVIDAAEMTPADVSEVLIRNRRNKGRALWELVEVSRMRAERNTGKKSGERNSGAGDNVFEEEEDEEQEKRALESPKRNGKFPEEEEEENVDEKLHSN